MPDPQEFPILEGLLKELQKAFDQRNEFAREVVLLGEELEEALAENDRLKGGF